MCISGGKLMELLFVAVYTVIWFGSGWLIGQNMLYRKMRRKLPGVLKSVDALRKSYRYRTRCNQFGVRLETPKEGWTE